MKITGRLTRPVTQILLNSLKPVQTSFRLHKNRIMQQSKHKIDYAKEINIMQHSEGKIVTQQKLRLCNTPKIRLHPLRITGNVQYGKWSTSFVQRKIAIQHERPVQTCQ